MAIVQRHKEEIAREFRDKIFDKPITNAGWAESKEFYEKEVDILIVLLENKGYEIVKRKK